MGITEVSDLTRGRNNEYHQDGYVLSVLYRHQHSTVLLDLDAHVHQCLCREVYLPNRSRCSLPLPRRLKAVLEERCIDAELNRRYVVIIRKQNTKERISSGSDSKIALLGTFLGSLAVGKYATGAVTDQTLHA